MATTNQFDFAAAAAKATAAIAATDALGAFTVVISDPHRGDRGGVEYRRAAEITGTAREIAAALAARPRLGVYEPRFEVWGLTGDQIRAIELARKALQ